MVIAVVALQSQLPGSKVLHRRNSDTFSCYSVLFYFIPQEHYVTSSDAPFPQAEIAQEDAPPEAEIDSSKVLRGLNVLDVGCGGGLLSEVRQTHPCYLYHLLNPVHQLHRV